MKKVSGTSLQRTLHKFSSTGLATVMLSNICEISGNFHRKINEDRCHKDVSDSIKINDYLNFPEISDGNVCLNFTYYSKCINDNIEN